MKKLLFISAAVLMMAGFSNKVMAQDAIGTDNVSLTMPVILDLDISNEDGLGKNDLAFVAPAAGAAILSQSSSNSWLNYTSVIGTGTTHMITAVIGTGTVPSGTTLTVVAAAPTGGGSTVTAANEKGVPQAAITLSGTGQKVIDLIRTCWTGSGDDTGSNLTYTWSIDEGYTAKSNTKATLTITYTIAVTI